MSQPSSDQFAAVRAAGTSAPNFDLDTDAIIERLTEWSALCAFTITSAEDDAVNLSFTTLPEDLEEFVQEIYDFCPDVVDQGTGCMQEMIEIVGDELDPKTAQLIEGVDLDDENSGFEILKRDIEFNKVLRLWWD